MQGAICGVDGKHIVNHGNYFTVDSVGLLALVHTGVYTMDDFLFNARYGKVSEVLTLMCGTKLKLRGYANVDNGTISDIGFDELFWDGKTKPTKHDIIRFVNVAKRPDELTVTYSNLRAWWD